MSLWELFLKGGIVMWPILICSFVAVYIIIERTLVLKKAKTDTSKFMLSLKIHLRNNQLRSAIDLCESLKVPVANIIKQGIFKFNEGHERIKESIQNAGSEEIYKLEKGLIILATVSGVAPLLGFLGTVTGLISAFRTVENSAGIVSPADLAGGIWEALLTTAFGLIVGIPAYFFYNYFINKIKRFIFEIETSTNDFLDVVRGEIESPSNLKK